MALKPIHQKIYDTLKETGKWMQLSRLANDLNMTTGALKHYLESDDLKDKVHVWMEGNKKMVTIPRGGSTISGGVGKSPYMITSTCEDCKREFEQSKMGRRSTRCSECREKHRLEQLRNRGKADEEEVLEEGKIEEEKEDDKVEEEEEIESEEKEVGDEIEVDDEDDESGEEEEVESEEEEEMEVEEDRSRLAKLEMNAMIGWLEHRIDKIIVDHILDKEVLGVNDLSLVKKIRKLSIEFGDKFRD